MSTGKRMDPSRCVTPYLLHPTFLLRIILHFTLCHWVMSLDLPADLTVSSSSA